MKNKSRAFYFVSQLTTGPQVDEITIWLNGGPGCSALAGHFQENSRLFSHKGQSAPEINPYPWMNLTNMIWVEQPVGTGFSIGEITATDEDIAQDSVDFVSNFQDQFCFQSFKIYVTGELDAGRDVPCISMGIIDIKYETHLDLTYQFSINV